MKTQRIIICILIMIIAIFTKKLRRFGKSPGDWVIEYEDETWAKIFTIVMRIVVFLGGMTALIHTLFFYK